MKQLGSVLDRSVQKVDASRPETHVPGDGLGSDTIAVVEKLQRLASEVAFESPGLARKIVAFARSLECQD
jgi:hypothetical protein